MPAHFHFVPRDQLPRHVICVWSRGQFHIHILLMNILEKYKKNLGFACSQYRKIAFHLIDYIPSYGLKKKYIYTGTPSRVKSRARENVYNFPFNNRVRDAHKRANNASCSQLHRSWYEKKKCLHSTHWRRFIFTAKVIMEL